MKSRDYAKSSTFSADPSVKEDDMTRNFGKKQQSWKTEIKNGVIKEIKELSEEQLRDNVIKPLFEQLGFIVEIADKKHEEEHKCDLLCRKDFNYVVGIQIKKDSYETTKSVDYKITPSILKAIHYNHGTSEITVKLFQYYWITSGHINVIGKRAIKKMIASNELIREKFIVWDVNKLFEEILCRKPDLLEKLKLYHYYRLAEYCEKKRKKIFASHCYYQAFLWYLRHRDKISGKNVLKQALSNLSSEPMKNIYYHRVIKKYYDLCINNAGVFCKYQDKKNIKLLDILRKDEVKKEFANKKLIDYLFLLDIAFILEQLYILNRGYANASVGLSSLDVCRLLLRMGFVPEKGSNIDIRLQRIVQEMKESRKSKFKQFTVDGNCSLCTSVAISCLSLAKRRKQASKAIDWLKEQKKHRYCFLDDSYTSSNKYEHAMHYAAQALQAFIDIDDKQSVKEIINIFFKNISKSKLTPDGFYYDWMKYKNITSFEICSYLFAPFLRYELSGFKFNREQKSHIAKMLKNLVRKLNYETVEKTMTARLYPARENIESLCLGYLIDHKEQDFHLLFDIINLIELMAKNRNNIRESMGWLMSSNVDRARIFLEGWLSYWETICYLEEEQKKRHNKKEEV